jgi:hypothetical protein
MSNKPIPPGWHSLGFVYDPTPPREIDYFVTDDKSHKHYRNGVLISETPIEDIQLPFPATECSE